MAKKESWVTYSVKAVPKGVFHTCGNCNAARAIPEAYRVYKREKQKLWTLSHCETCARLARLSECEPVLPPKDH